MLNTVEYLGTVHAPAPILYLDAKKILYNLVNIVLNGNCCIQSNHYFLFMASCWMQQFPFNTMLTKLYKNFWASRYSIGAGACTVPRYSTVFSIYWSFLIDKNHLRSSKTWIENRVIFNCIMYKKSRLHICEYTVWILGESIKNWVSNCSLKIWLQHIAKCGVGKVVRKRL